MNNSIILNKRQIRERLHGFVSARERIVFLKWQKVNLSNSGKILTDTVFYDNRLKWLNDQILVNTNVIDEEEHLLSEFF